MYHVCVCVYTYEANMLRNAISIGKIGTFGKSALPRLDGFHSHIARRGSRFQTRRPLGAGARTDRTILDWFPRDTRRSVCHRSNCCSRQPWLLVSQSPTVGSQSNFRSSARRFRSSVSAICSPAAPVGSFCRCPSPSFAVFRRTSASPSRTDVIFTINLVAVC